MIVEEILKRRSIRAYRPKAVEKDKLDRVLEAGRLAPTAKNAQDWQIIVVEDEQTKKALVEAAAPHQPFLYTAPLLLAACATNPNYVMMCNQPSYPIDLGIVLDHISLQAVREGLGTCWIGSFDEEGVKKVLKIPPHVRVAQLMSLGYFLDNPEPRPRKPKNHLFKWNHW
jgi:nitroreductase